MIAFHFFTAAGLLQGFVLAAWLFVLSRRQKHLALAWLAAFIAAFSGVLAGDVLNESGLIRQWPRLYQVFDPLILALGPCCYCYVRASVGLPPWALRRSLVHFAPMLLLYGLLSPGFFEDRATRMATIAGDLALLSSGHFGLLEYVLLGSSLLYLLAGLWQVRRYWQSLEQQYSDTEKFKLRWLVTLLAFCTLMWSLWLCALIGSWSWAETASRISLVLGVYALGFGGLSQPLLWRQLHVQSTTLAASPTHAAEALELQLSPLSMTGVDLIADAGSQSAKYAKSGASAEQLAVIGEQLTDLIRRELSFLEAELSLTDLASRLQVGPHLLSQTLNIHFGKNFFEFINTFRVQEVQRCFADPAFDGQSILEIALASGFASKATFNATFKRLTGMTPSASRTQLNQHRKQS